MPPEVKAATGALVAFRAAQSLGAGGLFSGGADLVTRGLDDIRLRAMLVSDEYNRLRQGQLDIIADAAGLDHDHAQAAAIFRTVDYWLWGLRNGLTEDPVRCARLLAAIR